MAVTTSEPTSIWALGGPLLEGPVWVAREQALYFVDIKRHRIYRLDPATGERAEWGAPAQVGFVLPIAGGGFVAGLQTGLARFDPKDGSFTPMHAPEPDLPGNRLNDGTIDGAGRLWFGSMDDAEAGPTGTIYRFDGKTSVATTPKVSITNGPAVSPDGRTLYHVDTLGQVIHAATLSGSGELSDPRVFARIGEGEGFPDGPTCDAEGCLWIGLYTGGAVRRYSPKGELLETVKFPVSAITKVAFGGADLKTVYATTANKHLDETGRAKEPLAGDLFSFTVNVPGVKLPEARI